MSKGRESSPGGVVFAGDMKTAVGILWVKDTVDLNLFNGVALVEHAYKELKSVRNISSIEIIAHESAREEAKILASRKYITNLETWKWTTDQQLKLKNDVFYWVEKPRYPLLSAASRENVIMNAGNGKTYPAHEITSFYNKNLIKSFCPSFDAYAIKRGEDINFVNVSKIELLCAADDDDLELIYSVININ